MRDILTECKSTPMIALGASIISQHPSTGCRQATYLGAARALDRQEVDGHPAALASRFSKSWSSTNIGMCIIMARRLRSCVEQVCAELSKGNGHTST